MVFENYVDKDDNVSKYSGPFNEEVWYLTWCFYYIDKNICLRVKQL